MNSSRRLAFALLLLALALAAIAALWQGRGGVAALVGLRAPDAPHAAASAAPAPLDALGRSVPVPATPPRRILVAGKAPFAIQDTLLLFPSVRAQATLIGPRSGAQRADAADLRAVLDSAWSAAPSRASAAVPLFTEGSAENIAAAAPDLVLLKSSSHLFGETLEPLGLPLAYLALETPDDYRRDLALLGTLLSAPDDAARLSAYYDATVSAISSAVARVRASGVPAPRVLLCQTTQNRSPDICRVPPPDWIQTWLVTAAGGIPVWTDSVLPGQWANVTMEQVAAWDPDVLVVVSYSAPATDGIAALAASPVWTDLRCWREGRVYPMPGDTFSWDLPSPRWILALQWLAARLLPPDTFPPDALPAAVIDFYALLGIPSDITRAEILPRIPEPL